MSTPYSGFTVAFPGETQIHDGYCGPRGHAEILYENARVPFENIVGGEAGLGQGFALAQKRLGPGRIHHAMRWLGQSRRAFDLLCERALTRYTHGSILAEKQMVQDWIAESYAEMHAARLLTLQAAWKMDQLHAAGKHYSDARVEIGVIKFWGAKVLYNVIDRAIQVHGSSRRWRKTSRWNRRCCCAPSSRSRTTVSRRPADSNGSARR